VDSHIGSGSACCVRRPSASAHLVGVSEQVMRTRCQAETPFIVLCQISGTGSAYRPLSEHVDATERIVSTFLSNI
jgi:hypothetical protein